jgi:integrase
VTRRGNNEGSIRHRVADDRWEARYTLPDGSRRSIFGKTRTEVREKLTKALRDLDQGVTAPKDERRTFGDYLDQWLEIKKPEIEYSYWKRCEIYIRRDIKPALGNVAHVKLSGQHLKALYTRELQEGAAANTVRHLHTTIHSALEDALRLDLVARNVAHLVRPLKRRISKCRCIRQNRRNSSWMRRMVIGWKRCTCSC